MKLPRDISGIELADLLKALGYDIVRQTGSHIRLRTTENGEHSITIPSHDAIKIGTLNFILKDIASHFEIDKKELVGILFDR